MLRLLLLLVVLPTMALAQSTQDKVREYRRANEHKIINEYLTLLSIPNVASDNPNIRKNAEFIAGMMKQRGLEPRLLEGPSPNTPPAVYAEWKVPGAQRTLLLYAHYDGQPTDPKQWTGTHPWKPVFRHAAIEAGGQIVPAPPATEPFNTEWRIYARSASDDKAGVMAILNAFAALKATGIAATSNIKFFFEGEEEAGSPHLAEIIKAHQQLLEADAWIICDGPVHQSGKKQVVFGARGDVNVDVTVYAAKRPLHSGHYGNWSPNPAMMLARLLSSMKDADGRVLVDGWYSDVEPLGERERRAIAEAPQYDEEIKKQLGLSRTEGAGKSLMELINVPSLNINGFASGDVGDLARNVIPTTATAVLDLRLVKGNDHRRQVERLIAHVRKQGYFVTDKAPTDAERAQHPLIARINVRPGGYNAERTSMDLPVSLAVIEAVQSTTPDKIVLLPTSGGSLPLSIITENLKTVTISVPIANYDNNQHAENENVILGNLWNGIETFAALMTMNPKEPQGTQR
ncbi:MAG TPA: M20/M25/M40 family metallo-hydrolase [Pyrinomonadaceae bacterium]|nr:M20/M25/M40 family metallo-hydrolase [Pyrinomonadaceae bacterium]